jgi:predicted metal-dependent hydrolase
MSNSPEYDPRFLQGIRYFNNCDFFEAHEIWEEVWSETQGASRRFYQGLIQVAVCLHHFGNGNLHGARKLYYSCRGYLQDYSPRHLGVNIDQLLGQLQQCCADLLTDGGPLPTVSLAADLIPEIHLDPPAI